ncbi:MAG: hypothetical protein L0H74_11275, partial [Brachybacterium sp.]|nr:hypothetical protein [Brachybacterium sp.]
RLPTAATEPGRTRWAVGRDGDVVTVIDDLDTASLQIAEDLARAWTCFLRGTHAGEPVTAPAPAEPEPAEPESAGPEPPGPTGTGQVLPPEQPQEIAEDSLPEYFAWEPPVLRQGHRSLLQEPESSPEAWEDPGPPPF